MAKAGVTFYYNPTLEGLDIKTTDIRNASKVCSQCPTPDSICPGFMQSDDNDHVLYEGPLPEADKIRAKHTTMACLNMVAQKFRRQQNLTNRRLVYPIELQRISSDDKNLINVFK